MAVLPKLKRTLEIIVNLLMADSRLGDIRDETQFGVACLVAVEGGVDDMVGKGDGGDARVGLVYGTTDVDGEAGEVSKQGEAGEVSKEGKAGEVSKKGEVSLLLEEDSKLGDVGGGLLIADLRLGGVAGVVDKVMGIGLGETMVLMENVGPVSRGGMFATVAGAEHIHDLSELSGFLVNTFL